MQILKVQDTEVAQLRAFAERTFRIAYEADNEPARFEQYCQNAFSPAQFQLEWEHPGSTFWIAWEMSNPVAYMKLNFDQHPEALESKQTVQVERLYVEPALQGQKIGEKMLEFAAQQAKSVQADWIWISVWQARPNAVRFYEKCGYEIFGTEYFWLDDEAQLDWLMRKKI